MSSIWYAVIAGVIVLLVSFVSSRIWHRVTKTSKPRFSREAGTSARATLNRTKNIFNSANSLGGRLTYPWKIKDGTVTEPEMQEALDAIHAEIVDKELRESIVTIKKQLRDVFAAARQVIPMVVYSGMPELPDQAEVRKLERETASRQRDAADDGLVATSAAFSRLDKLSANL